jgi:hypothetical protein
MKGKKFITGNKKRNSLWLTKKCKKINRIVIQVITWRVFVFQKAKQEKMINTLNGGIN